MQRQKVGVILASEYPEVRHFFREVAEGEDGIVILGQAENATKALTLARHLRPDVAIIDCYLPHAIGLDTVPLSRIGGLDTAQHISEEIPNTQVILVNNLDNGVLPADGLSSDVTAVFSIEREGTTTALALQDLYHQMEQLNTLVFANVVVVLRPRASLRQKAISLRGEDLVFGGLGIVGGLSLIVTLVFAGAWVILALAGAIAIGFGIAGIWKKVKQGVRD